MTRFVILYQNQFRVNDLCLNKNNVQIFLRKLYDKFKFVHFAIKEIHSSYSDKSERAMIFIALRFKIVDMVLSRKRHPQKYHFTGNAHELIEDILTQNLSEN